MTAHAWQLTQVMTQGVGWGGLEIHREAEHGKGKHVHPLGALPVWASGLPTPDGETLHAAS